MSLVFDSVLARQGSTFIAQADWKFSSNWYASNGPWSLPQKLIFEHAFSDQQRDRMHHYALERRDHAEIVHEFMKPRRFTVTRKFGETVLALIEQGKFSGQDDLHRTGDLTLEDFTSLFPGNRPSPRVIVSALGILVAGREDASFVHPTLLHRARLKNWDSATVDEIGWLLHPSCALKSKKHDNALGSAPYKAVFLYMPDAGTQSEVLAMCMVSKMTCDVILYGAGENQKDINLALEEAQKQYKKLLSRAFSSKAGSYAWWDKGKSFQLRFCSAYADDPKTHTYKAWDSGIRVLDLAIRVRDHTFEDLLLHGRLSGFRDQPEVFRPLGIDSIDVNGIRRDIISLFIAHLKAASNRRSKLSEPIRGGRASSNPSAKVQAAIAEIAHELAVREGRPAEDSDSEDSDYLEEENEGESPSTIRGRHSQ
jgi:hypothetical protein